MATMRTIPQAVKEFQAKDPNTPVGRTTLRRWVKQGFVKSVSTGKFPLVNMESLEAFLSGETAQQGG